MTNKRSTKRALIASVISLMLCFTMLMGTTYAWFTDSVASTNNIIQSGNLDVELYWSTDNSTWKKVDSNTNVFTSTLWEPGHTEVVYLKVVNEGSLALKYQLGVNVASEIGSTNVKGDPFKLSDFIKYGVVATDTAFADRDKAVAAVTNPTELKNAFLSEVTKLDPVTKDASNNDVFDLDVVAMVVYMPTDVGNDANYAKDAAVPQINLGINLYATQVEAESDSFGPDYDKDAVYTNVVSSADGLAEALANIKDGQAIMFADDIEGVDGSLITDKNITIDLNGYTYTVSEGASTNSRNFLINGNSNVTIKNGTLIGSGNINSGAYGTIRTEGSANVTLSNMKLYNYRGNGLNIKALGGTTVTINDTEIYSQYGGGVEAAGGIVELNNVKIEQKGMWSAPYNSMTVSVNGGGKATINGGIYTTECLTAEEANNQGSSHGPWTIGVLNSGGTLVVNGGTFSNDNFGENSLATYARGLILADTGAVVEINGGTFNAVKAIVDIQNNLGDASKNPTATFVGGTFSADPTASGFAHLTKVADGYAVTNNGDGTYTVDREYTVVTPAAGATATENGAALADTIHATTENTFLQLGTGEYKMPSISGSKEFTIVGTKDTVIDVTMGAYMDSSKVSFEGVTIKGSTGMANGNGSDYAALYTPNVTYTNCTFDGPFRIGRDGATFINCKFTNLGNDYVWTYGNDATFKGCTFESDGKALLIYSDGGNEVSKVVVEDCVFNATQSAKAGAIANQSCAAIEIQNYGNSVNLTISGNTIDSDFSGEWRIKAYHDNKPAVIVNGVTYTTIALDGKTMTKDTSNNVTVVG